VRIYLDFDGVIRPWLQGTSTRAIHLLNRVLSQHSPNVVISSAWRKGRTSLELSRLLASWGVRGALVVGKTPEFPGILTAAQRTAEIRAHMQAHPYTGRIVVLDDLDVCGLQRLGVTVVKPSKWRGLTRKSLRGVL
jgi:hypothetical protein